MSLFTSIAATALGAALALSATAAQAQPLPAVEQLYRLDGLPTFRSSTVGMVSSHDRTGGNDDGFEGTYSFVRKEPGGLVIADLKGPGVVTRIWTPTPSQDPIAFYFDDEPEPRIVLPVMDLFSGKAAPFLAPLSGMGAGGFYTYVPLTYQRALKVVVRSEKFNFYQLNYATYPAGTHVASYSPTDASFAKHFDSLDPRHLLAFDTETTGLAGGTGTRAFMIGAADLTPDGRLRVRQLLTTTLAAEAAMLDTFAGWLHADTVLVSYNGRSYDSPLLKTRYRLARMPCPVTPLRHLDLLHPARRRWRGVWENCRLATIERHVLHVLREDDLPGSEAPRAWRDYLQGGDARDLRRVLQHNHTDVRSLMALLAHMAHATP